MKCVAEKSQTLRYQCFDRRDRAQRAEEGGGADGFRRGPPDLVGEQRGGCRSRACRRSRPCFVSQPRVDGSCGRASPRPPAARHACLPSSTQSCSHEPRPFEPVAGRRAGRAEHVGALVGLVDVPVRVEMLGHDIVERARHAGR